MTVKLRRAPMWRKDSVPNPLDVTVKGAKGKWKPLAPTWSMVMGHKRGTLSNRQYTSSYLAKLENDTLYEGTALYLWHHGRENEGEITFICFCADKKFCHTHLLINWLCRIWPQWFEDGRTPTKTGEKT